MGKLSIEVLEDRYNVKIEPFISDTYDHRGVHLQHAGYIAMVEDDVEIAVGTSLENLNTQLESYFNYYQTRK
jgi:hypothetical protein